MALKRKRSSPFLSSPLSDLSTATTAPSDSAAIPNFYQQQKPTPVLLPLEHKSAWSWPTYDDTPSTHHLNSRTRKRHRDDRPAEQQIYGASCWLGAVIQMSALADICRGAASTIQRLYDAQRKHPEASPTPSHPHLSAAVPQQIQPQRSTLHSFWQLPPGSTITAPPLQVSNAQQLGGETAMRCEDCDQDLHSDDAMEIDGGFLEHETACVFCRRAVCDRCAVRGDERVCLSCVSGR